MTIMFKQFPLNGLNTFEDKLLFMLAGTIIFIKGIDTHAKLNGRDIIRCHFQCCDNPVDSLNLNDLAMLFLKYNKSLSGLFEINLIKDNRGIWNLNIKEDLNNELEI